MTRQFFAILAVSPALLAWGIGNEAGAQPRTHAVSVGAPVFSQFLGDEAVIDAPLSARITTRTVQELHDGNRLVNESVVMLSRDSAGRLRRESAIPGFSPARSTITISDPVAGEVLTLDPGNRRAFRLAGASRYTSTFTIRLDGEAQDQPTDELVQAPAAAPGDQAVAVISGQPAGTAGAVSMTSSGVSTTTLPTTFFVGRFNQPSTLSAAAVDGLPGPEVTLESLGEAEVSGVLATGERQTTTYPVGLLGNELPIVVTKETWYAPDLGMVVRSEERDPRFGTISYTVDVLSTEEPDSSLFEVPADYGIMSPVIEPPVRIDPQSIDP